LRKPGLIAIAIAGAVALGVWAISGWLASGWLASDWFKAKNLPVEVVEIWGDWSSVDMGGAECGVHRTE